MEPDETNIHPDEQDPSFSGHDVPVEDFESHAEVTPEAATSEDSIWGDTAEAASNPTDDPFDETHDSVWSEASVNPDSESAGTDSASSVEVSTHDAPLPGDVEVSAPADQSTGDSDPLPEDAASYPEGHYLAEQAAAHGLHQPSDSAAAEDTSETPVASAPETTEHVEGQPADPRADASDVHELSTQEPRADNAGAEPGADDLPPDAADYPEGHFFAQQAAAHGLHHTSHAEPVSKGTEAEAEADDLPPDAADYPEGHFFAQQAAAHGMHRSNHAESSATDAADTTADSNAPLGVDQHMADTDREWLHTPATASQPHVSADPYPATQGITYEQALAEIERLERSLHPAPAIPDPANFAPRESSRGIDADSAFGSHDGHAEGRYSGREVPEAAADDFVAREAVDTVSSETVLASSHHTESAARHTSREGSEREADDVAPHDHHAPIDLDASTTGDHVYHAPLAEPMSSGELAALLNDKAHHAGEHLAWKTSVVDLLKLLGQDSSREARGRLAVELGLPGAEHADTGSAKFNEQLHHHLLSTLARHGGDWPANPS